MGLRVMTIITVLIIVGYLIATKMIKEHLFMEISNAVKEDNQEEFRKLIFSLKSSLFLNQNKVFLMRSNSCLYDNNNEEANKWCNLINPKKLNEEDLKNYFQIKMRLVLENGDEKDINKLIEETKKIENKENVETIEMFVYQLNIYKQLVFQQNTNMEEALLGEIENANDKKKSGIYMILAHYYHMSKKEQQALEMEEKAMKYFQEEREGE